MPTEGKFLTELARRTVERWAARKGRESIPAEIPTEFDVIAACFVSIKNSDGSLRGCMGTLEPSSPTLSEEVIRNAISASSEDPRFPPVNSREVASLNISVDVLSEPEQIESAEDLDPSVYGIIVQSGYRRGVLLPDLQGVDTVAKQIGITLQKAGIPHDVDLETVELYRFTVRRYPERD